MGGVTPVFGIRYPYQGEAVAPAHFQNFADDVDAALDLLQTTADAATVRAQLRLSKTVDGPPTVASGVDADINWTDVRSERPTSLWAIGSPANIVLPVKGLYAYHIQTGQHSPVTTVTAQMIRARVNGVHYNAHRRYRDGESFTSGHQFAGVVPCLTAGHILVFSYRWNGTGGPAATPDAQLWLELLAEIP